MLSVGEIADEVFGDEPESIKGPEGDSKLRRVRIADTTPLPGISRPKESITRKVKEVIATANAFSPYRIYLRVDQSPACFASIPNLSDPMILVQPRIQISREPAAGRPAVGGLVALQPAVG